MRWLDREEKDNFIQQKDLFCWYPFSENATLFEVPQTESVDFGKAPEASHLGQYDYVVLEDFATFQKNQTKGYTLNEVVSYYQQYLTPAGKMLLALDNRLGAAFLSGAKEAGTGLYFEGISGFSSSDRQYSYSYQEIIEELSDLSGFTMSFFYPYPNHRITTEIYTDQSLYQQNYGKPYFNFAKQCLELFPEALFTKDLKKEGVLQHFVNSFLLELSWETETEEKIYYAKLNKDRRKEFQIVTVIGCKNGIPFARKQGLSKEAARHLKHMNEMEQQKNSGAYSYLQGVYENGRIDYPYLEGKSLDYQVGELISRRDKVGLLQLLQDALEGMVETQEEKSKEFYQKEFQEVFGTAKLSGEMTCIKPANIDLIPANIFKVDQSYKVIDGEWIFDFWVPKKFILWRMLWEMRDCYSELEQWFSWEEALDKLEITKEMDQVFYQWNFHFTQEYVAADRKNQNAIPRKYVDFKSLFSSEEIAPCLYLDYGEGFDEKHRLVQAAELKDTSFELTYHLQETENIKGIRWDPVEKKLCRCKLYCGNMRVKPLNSNGREDDWDIFFTGDPQYIIDITKVQGQQLKLYGQYQIVSEEELVAWIEHREQKQRNLLKKIYSKWKETHS